MFDLEHSIAELRVFRLALIRIYRSPRRRWKNPEGILSSSPGLRGTKLPWVISRVGINSEGVAPLIRHAKADATSFEVEAGERSFPG
jgi:hypothetical protein